MQLQSQQDYQLAIRCVSEVKAEDARVIQSYGSRCHDFPIMLITCGLAQTVAFYGSKQTEHGVGAGYRLILSHASWVLLGDERPWTELQDHVLGLEWRAYLTATARLIDAWVYFKRLAVSVLKVEAGTEPDSKVPHA